MGARHKLNSAYFMGSILLAGVMGGLTQSWAVFFVALVVLVACNLAAGEIRPNRRK
jgi:hypothetical protein